MFRPMRRKAQQMSEADCLAVLARAQEGVLSVQGDDGYPYGVPVNFLYADGRIILHCAREGHKMDALRRSDKVSFCVVDERTVVPSEYSTAYRSVILFGRARVVEEAEAMIPLLDALAARFVPDGPDARRAYIDKYLRGVAVVEIAVEHMTGKEGRLLMQKRTEAE